MSKIRIQIPTTTAATVLFKSDHTCCKCNNPNLGVQIHHIDGNPSNNDELNLMTLCLHDHDRASSKSNMSKGYGQDELSLYKQKWEQTVETRRRSLQDPPMARLIRFDGTDVNTIYLETSPSKLRAFQDPLTFELLGFNWGNVDVYPDSFREKFEFDEHLKKITDCKKIRLVFQNGNQANEVYLIWEDGRKHHIPDPETLKEIGGEPPEELPYEDFNSYPHGVKLKDIFEIRTNRIMQKAMTKNS